MNQNRARNATNRSAKKPLKAKSGKQKKSHMTEKRAAKQTTVIAKQLAKKEKERRTLLATKKREGVEVNEAALTPINSYNGWPEFVYRGYYIDQPFKCKDCGKEEIWTASRQKWWYEVAKGDVRAQATQCNACRRKRREKLAGERVAANLNRAKQGLPPLPDKQ